MIRLLGFCLVTCSSTLANDVVEVGRSPFALSSERKVTLGELAGGRFVLCQLHYGQVRLWRRGQPESCHEFIPLNKHSPAIMALALPAECSNAAMLTNGVGGPPWGVLWLDLTKHQTWSPELEQSHSLMVDQRIDPYEIAVSRDGTTIAIAAARRAEDFIGILDTRSRKLVAHRVFERAEAPSIEQMQLSDDGSAVLVVSSIRGANCWHMRSGEELVNHVRGMPKCVGYSNRERAFLVAETEDGLVLIKSIDGKRRSTLEAAGDQLCCFSPTGEFYLTARAGGRVRLFDVPTGKRLGEIVATGKDEEIDAIAFGHTSKRVLIGTRSKETNDANPGVSRILLWKW